MKTFKVTLSRIISDVRDSDWVTISLRPNETTFQTPVLKTTWSLLMHTWARRSGCVISIQTGVKGDAYPVAITQKVTKNLPVSIYSPMPGFKLNHTSIFICTSRQSPDFFEEWYMQKGGVHSYIAQRIIIEHLYILEFATIPMGNLMILPCPFHFDQSVHFKPFQGERPWMQQLCQKLLCAVCCLFGKVKITNTSRFLCRGHIWHIVYFTEYIMHRSLHGI